MRIQTISAAFPVWTLSLVLAVAMTVFSGCGGGEEATNTPSETSDTPAESTDETPRVTPVTGSDETSPFANTPKVHPVINPVVIFRTSHGEITVELDAKNAPVTVDNFLSNYVNRSFYNDTIFHYVESGMIVGGGYDSQNQLKEPREEIRCEADNGLSNQRGTLAMARAPDYAHSATSQFFFNLADNSSFDHQSTESPDTYGYCVFGKVTGGMAVLDKIAGVAVSESEISPKIPVEPVVIRTIEVTKQ